jgi:Lrp/AsnC family leucine-responsive transcriptional regulator
MDTIDARILKVLRDDARRSYREIAETVALSPTAVADRVRRLIDTGVIRGFYTDVDPASDGRKLFAFVDLRLGEGVAAANFERLAAAVRGVESMTLTTGHFDYTLRVGCADQQSLVDIIEALRVKCGARETYSRIIIREVKVQ